MDAVTLIAAVAIAAVAGVVRGITGFGGAIVMSPPLALLLGPRITVAAVLVLEAIVALPMLVQTHRLVHWRTIGVILAAACLTIPLGVRVLVAVDPNLIRRAMAVIVITFALVLLRGWRYSGRQRLVTSVALGAASGGMLGATSVGAPPVILYLLSGPDPIETTRANLTLYATAISVIGLAALAYNGVLDAQAASTSLWLAPAYYVGLAGGVKLFSRFSDTRFRRFTLMLLVVSSIGILLA